MSPSRSLPPVKNFRARPAFLMQGQIAEFSHRIRERKKGNDSCLLRCSRPRCDHSL
jgi:hypothetical protein